MDPAGLVRTGTLALDRGVLPTTEVVARVHRIQEIMRSLMKEGVHYGTIPGTPKPSLLKPGAELLLMSFRIAPTPSLIEDLSTPDEIRYRVTVRGTHQVSADVVGEMVGECSSNEEKYRWRKPVCDEEFDETPADRRREKWAKGRDGAYKQKQVRTSPADVANTILKMATKRALIALTLSALAASDIFAQDLEDLSAELRESVVDETASKPSAKEPQRKSAAAGAMRMAKAMPSDAQTIVGLVAAKVYDDKKPYAFYLKGAQTKYTTFDDALLKEVKGFAGTDHQVTVSFTVTQKDGRTYHNAVGIAIVDAEPAKASPSTPPPLIADDIFGGADRQPGEDG
jgi:hypothetical protein